MLSLPFSTGNCTIYVNISDFRGGVSLVKVWYSEITLNCHCGFLFDPNLMMQILINRLFCSF